MRLGEDEEIQEQHCPTQQNRQHSETEEAEKKSESTLSSGEKDESTRVKRTTSLGRRKKREEDDHLDPDLEQRRRMSRISSKKSQEKKIARIQALQDKRNLLVQRNMSLKTENAALKQGIGALRQNIVLASLSKGQEPLPGSSMFTPSSSLGASIASGNWPHVGLPPRPSLSSVADLHTQKLLLLQHQLPQAMSHHVGENSLVSRDQSLIDNLAATSARTESEEKQTPDAPELNRRSLVAGVLAKKMPAETTKKKASHIPAGSSATTPGGSATQHAPVDLLHSAGILPQLHPRADEVGTSMSFGSNLAAHQQHQQRLASALSLALPSFQSAARMQYALAAQQERLSSLSQNPMPSSLAFALGPREDLSTPDMLIRNQILQEEAHRNDLLFCLLQSSTRDMLLTGTSSSFGNEMTPILQHLLQQQRQIVPGQTQPIPFTTSTSVTGGGADVGELAAILHGHRAQEDTRRPSHQDVGSLVDAAAREGKEEKPKKDPSSS